MNEVERSMIGTLEVEGTPVPYVDLEDEPFVHSQLRVGDTVYTYERSYPIKGHSAVMPQAIAEYQERGKQILVVERRERYYIYLA